MLLCQILFFLSSLQAFARAVPTPWISLEASPHEPFTSFRVTLGFTGLDVTSIYLVDNMAPGVEGFTTRCAVPILTGKNIAPTPCGRRTWRVGYSKSPHQHYVVSFYHAVHYIDNILVKRQGLFDMADYEGDAMLTFDLPPTRVSIQSGLTGDPVDLVKPSEMDKSEQRDGQSRNDASLLDLHIDL